MQTARRLYVYLLSGISLGVLATGLTMLLGVAFDRLGLGAGQVIGESGDVIGQQLTLSSALTVVGLPVWLIHWFAAERSVRPDRSDAALERTSTVRGLYFAVAMGALLFAAATGLRSIVMAIVARIAGGDQLGSESLAGGLGLALVAGAAWAYHVRIRTRDWSRGPMTDGGAWLPRSYLYVAVFVGLVSFLGGLTGLIDVVARVAFDQPPAFSDPSASTWWTYPLADALNGLLIGGVVWLGHAWYAERLIRDPGWRGDSERPARLRLAFFVAAIIATAAGTIYELGTGIGGAIARLAGATGSATTDLVGGIAVPIVSAVPYAVAWWWHARHMEREAAASGASDRVETEDRLELYPVALVGLAFGAVSLAWIVSLLIDAGFGSGRVLAGADVARTELARYVPLALLGVAAWLWAWRRVMLRGAVDPLGEATSTTRRASLLIVLAAAVLAGVVSAALILYRLFGSVFGVEQSADVVSALSLPIASLVVAGLVAAYHAVQLRRDQALRASAPVEALTMPTPEAAVGASMALRLSGPPDGDLPAVVASLRSQLPPGFELERG